MVADDEIRAALRRVLDPCSIAAGNPISLLDMGLIQDWSVSDDGDISVRMCVTSPTCTMAPHFTGQAETELERIDGVRSATVSIDTAVFWTEDMMDPAVREARLRRLRERAEAAGIRPRGAGASEELPMV